MNPHSYRQHFFICLYSDDESLAKLENASKGGRIRGEGESLTSVGDRWCVYSPPTHAPRVFTLVATN